MAAASTGAPHQVLLSTHEKENFQRIARLLIARGTAIMRETFDTNYSSSLLVKLNTPSIKKKLKGAKLTKPQNDCLYPPTGRCPTSEDFDISLLFKLFRTICNLPPPATGWDAFPPDTDHCLTAELVRIKEYRNKVCHHYFNMEMSDKEFESLWNDIRTTLIRVASLMRTSAQYAWERAIDKLLIDPLTPKAESHVKELKEWYENDVECKEIMNKGIKRLEDSFQGGIMSVTEAIKKTEENIVSELHKAIDKKIDPGASLQSPGKGKGVVAQKSDFPGPDVQSVLHNTSSACAGQLPQVTVQQSTQVRERVTTASSQTGAELQKSLDVDSIGDFKELCEIAIAVGMKTEGFETIKQIKNKLREHIKEESKRREFAKTFEVISEAGKADEHKRRELFLLYADAREVLNELDDDFKNTLETTLGDFRTTLEENMKSLGPRDQYVVLVAGETSAGKSSVINLILGEEILPNAVLSTTSTIFELKYGRTPTISAHLKDSREPVCYKLVGSKETYAEQIKNFVGLKKDRGTESPYKKIELFWPHPLFQERVMIVDSPGVGDSDAMNEVVRSYLPNAFCFIYVINSINAGGVQEDRLGMLLSCASKLKREAKMDLKLFASCALFVCNKWDEIKPAEVEEVKSEQVEKLTKKLGSLDPKSQIVYLSCKQAQKAQEYGVITSDFDDLISGISNLIVSSMQSNLEIYTRWLDDLLSRTSFQIRVLLKSTTMSRLQKDDKMKKIKKRMEELQSSQKQTIDELGEYQTSVIWEIMGKLAFHFKTQDTSARFCKWSPDEVPAPKATWIETENEVLKCISERSQHFVQDWEDDEHEFAKAQNEMIKFLCKKFNLMEEEIRKVEEVLFVDETPNVLYQEQRSIAKTQERFQKVPIVNTNPVWLRQGLASVVIRSPFSTLMSKIKEKLNFQTEFQQYKKEPCDYMSKRCHTACLEVFSAQDRLLPFINEQLEDSVQVLKQIKEKIPKLIEGDKQLYQQLLTDTRSKTDIQNFYEPLNARLETLMRDVTLYTVKEIRRSDFTSRDIKWTEDSKSIIGRGSFSTVYTGFLSRKEEVEVKVALKVYTDSLTRENVWHFIEEEQALRKLRHSSIVKFYGTNLLQAPNDTKVMIVLELCMGSLENFILSNPGNDLFRRENEAARRKELVLRWAVQILDALHYIHVQGFVHQNLILENVLLTKDENVKLTGIGVGKFTRNEESNLRYLAPEVLQDRIYDSRADMYSFGLLLWELWYCERAFGTSTTSRLQHLNGLKRGLRPQHIDGTDRPLPTWLNVMLSCWSGEPRDRLTAHQSWEQLRELQSAEKKTQKVRPTPPPKPSRKVKRN